MKLKIEIDKLRKGYNSNQSFNLEIDGVVIENGVTCLVGNNGSGKTTLIKTILNLRFPSSGEISINGLNNTFSNSLTNTIYIPSEIWPNKELTGFDYISSILMLRNYEMDFIKSELDLLSSFFGFDLSVRIKSMSKGMKQSLVLANLFFVKNNIIVMDEPFNGIDHHKKEIICNQIQEIKKDNLILFATHDIGLMKNLSDKVILLSEGKIDQYANLELISWN